MPNTAVTLLPVEIKLIEKYRDLLPEFQKALLADANNLFKLQTEIMRQVLTADNYQ